MDRVWSSEIAGGKGRCLGSVWVTMGHLRVDLFNPNSEGLPATHLREGGAHCAPPGKYSTNGPN